MGWESKQLETICGTCGIRFGEHGDGSGTGEDDSEMLTWRCPRTVNGHLSGYHPTHHFSPPSAIKAEPKATDLSNWRAWANNHPGECACGIRKEKCDYHR